MGPNQISRTNGLWYMRTAIPPSAVASPSDEPATLRKIVNQYFLSSVGDLAADRLGDVLFEQGNFAEAAALWQSAAEEYPDPNVSAAELQAKRCVALARLGRRDELASLVETVKQQYAGQTITIGGEQVDAAEFERAFNLPLTAIGRATASGQEVRFSLRGERVAKPSGYDHFSR